MSADAAGVTREIARNVAIHDRIARKYDKQHGEIFNDIEQLRLREALIAAKNAIRSSVEPPQALDFGCGSGNLTGHLLELGFQLTAADVADGFLQLVRSRYATQDVKTLHLNGRDLSNIPDASFDMVATYSVLHHVPDYLTACAEMARVCRKGGVILIDHEAAEEYWHADPLHAEFRRAALRFDWAKYLTPSNYLHRLRRLIEPRYSNEGDIHVWPDDHIEWAKIKEMLGTLGFEVVREEKYLLYRRLYRRQVFDRYKGRCADTQMMIFRKIAD